MSVSTAQGPFTRHTARTARRAALAASLIAVLAVAGCSSSSSSKGSGGSGSGGSTGTASTDSVVATASKLLSEASTTAVTGPSFGAVTSSQIVPWKASAMPQPMALPKTKVSVDIVYGLAVGEGPYITKLTGELAKKLGWSVKTIRATSQSQPDTLAAFQQAILDKPTAIIAFVVPGVWVGGALTKAKAAGIYTVDVHQDSTTGAGYDAFVPDGEGVQKSLMAAYAIKDSKGKASSLLVDAPGFSDSNMPAAKTYLSTCSGCKTQAKQINPTDLIDPIKLQSDVTSLLGTQPGLDYLMWPSASLPLQPVVTAIRSSSSKDAKVLVNGMAPAAINLVKTGSVPLVVQSPDALLALVALDDVSRLVQKKPVIAQDAIRVPISFWDKDNVPASNDFAGITKDQLKNDFVTPYEKAWGVSLRPTLLTVK